jgi:molecular chaperone DnaK
LDNGVFHVLATHGDTRLGGDDIDSALLSLLLAAAARPGERDGGDPVLAARLREAAVEAKHRLSDEEEARIELPFAGDRENFSYSLTRAELERLAGPILERTREHCLRALADARLSPGDLDEVVLAGGVTRMPLVRRFTAGIFLREPNTSQNPDEAVALGATIQAGILEGSVQNMVLLDVTPLSLGIETFGGLMNIIIPRNSTIPLKAGEMFTNAMPNQASMLIKVLQGEREMARDNWPLGQFEIPFDAAAKGQARVGVQFEIDASGILHVLARDTKTGLEKTVEIQSAVDVSDEAVEKMIAESVENAFEDMNERILTETKLKAAELLAALSHAFAVAGDKLEPAEKSRIEELAQEVRLALESGELARLKRANAALDDGTQHLATVLVELAMSGAAKRSV